LWRYCGSGGGCKDCGNCEEYGGYGGGCLMNIVGVVDIVEVMVNIKKVNIVGMLEVL
jgi:hypothetical protein